MEAEKKRTHHQGVEDGQHDAIVLSGTRNKRKRSEEIQLPLLVTLELLLPCGTNKPVTVIVVPCFRHLVIRILVCERA